MIMQIQIILDRASPCSFTAHTLFFLPDPTRFLGSSSIQLAAITSQPSIRFHSDELTLALNNITVKDSHGDSLPVQEIHLDFQRTFVTLVLEKEMEEGGQYLLTVPFTADILREDDWFAYGFYHQPCYRGTEEQCWSVANQHQANHS